MSHYIYNMRTDKYLIFDMKKNTHEMWVEDYRTADTNISEVYVTMIEGFMSNESPTPVNIFDNGEHFKAMATAVALCIMNKEPCMAFPSIVVEEGDMTYLCPDFTRGESIDYSQERLISLRGKI